MFSNNKDYTRLLQRLRDHFFGNGKKGPEKIAVANFTNHGISFIVFNSSYADKKEINMDVYKNMNKFFVKAQKLQNFAKLRKLKYTPYRYIMTKYNNADGDEFMFYCSKTVPLQQTTKVKIKESQEQVDEIVNNLRSIRGKFWYDLAEARIIKRQLSYFKSRGLQVPTWASMKLEKFIKKEDSRLQEEKRVSKQKEQVIQANIQWIKDKSEERLFYDCLEDTEKLHRLSMFATALKTSCSDKVDISIVRKVGRLVKDLNLTL